jgi:hypothetical protein
VMPKFDAGLIPATTAFADQAGDNRGYGQAVEPVGEISDRDDVVGAAVLASNVETPTLERAGGGGEDLGGGRLHTLAG